MNGRSSYLLPEHPSRQVREGVSLRIILIQVGFYLGLYSSFVMAPAAADIIWSPELSDAQRSTAETVIEFLKKYSPEVQQVTSPGAPELHFEYGPLKNAGGNGDSHADSMGVTSERVSSFDQVIYTVRINSESFNLSHDDDFASLISVFVHELVGHVYSDENLSRLDGRRREGLGWVKRSDADGAGWVRDELRAYQSQRTVYRRILDEAARHPGDQFYDSLFEHVKREDAIYLQECKALQKMLDDPTLRSRVEKMQ